MQRARVELKPRRSHTPLVLSEHEALFERRCIKVAIEHPEWTDRQVRVLVSQNSVALLPGGVEAQKKRVAAAIASEKYETVKSKPIVCNENLDNVHGREMARSQRHERRLALSSTAPDKSYTPSQWASLCAEYDNRCACCGEEKSLTVDHIIPVSRGGRNSIENIQPLCRSCNSSKGTKKTNYRVH